MIGAEERLGPRGHWRGNLGITGGLLLVWVVVTFGGVYFARELTFAFFGWPFAFFLGAQGAPIVYLVLVWIYAVRMAALDRRFGVSDDDAPDQEAS